jgi:hypothetical protein
VLPYGPVGNDLDSAQSQARVTRYVALRSGALVLHD